MRLWIGAIVVTSGDSSSNRNCVSPIATQSPGKSSRLSVGCVVDERAPSAAGVFEIDVAVDERDPGVNPRDAGIGEPQVAVLSASDNQDGVVGQLAPLAHVRTTDDVGKVVHGGFRGLIRSSPSGRRI